MLLVVNPRAGGGRAARVAPAVLRALRSTGWRVRVHVTRDLDDAEQAAADPGAGVVTALGGDGLLARVAAGVRRSGAVLAPLPGGRGNDFCAALGVARDPAVAAASLVGAGVRGVDVAQVCGRTVLGAVSCGFDAETNARANATRWVRGPLVYLAAAARTLATWAPVEVSVTVDGRPQPFRGFMVVVANSGRYGGGMRIAPGARLDDGELDVVTVSDISTAQFLATLPRVYRGGHVQHPAVRVVRGATVHLDGAVALEVYADGEMVGRLPCEVTVVASALRVLVG